MARVKRGVTAHAKHKKVLEQAKGFYGRRKNTIRTAKAAVDKAGQYAYRDRKVRKRNFRSLWIQRINAAARLEGFTYSQFIHGLDEAGVEIDRKVLADIAGQDPAAFKAIADKTSSGERHSIDIRQTSCCGERQEPRLAVHIRHNAANDDHAAQQQDELPH
jgi:large subunit ribosomal protein L20